MAYQEAQVLTGEERQRWERDGYLVLELSSTESTIDGILNDLEPLWDKEGIEDNVAYQRHRIRNAWKVSDNVKAVARDAKVLAVLEQLYGRTPLPFQTLNFRYGTQQAVHSDAVHFGSDPPHFMAGVWVALEDIHEDSGPLVYYPGTHKLPEISMRDAGAEADREQYDRYERYVRDFIEDPPARTQGARAKARSRTTTSTAAGTSFQSRPETIRPTTSRSGYLSNGWSPARC
jgi:hypothetical protein